VARAAHTSGLTANNRAKNRTIHPTLSVLLQFCNTIEIS
jgi:hypothetical protein